MRSAFSALLFTFLLAATGLAQANPKLSPLTRQFVTVNAPVIALTHVGVIDGTGAPPREDQTIVIDHGRIASVGDASSTPPPAGAKVMDL
ncbi:MAG: amidohydrolase family protein, partial [Terriglobia bacterium]